MKWQKGYGDRGPGQIMQIRTEPADIVNTVLKMASKRAHIAMVINVLAASDIFAQDLEDLTEEQLREREQGGGGQQRQNTQAPRSTGATGAKTATQAQQGLLVRKLEAAGIDARLLCEHFKVESLAALPMSQVDAAIAWISGGKGVGSGG